MTVNEPAVSSPAGRQSVGQIADLLRAHMADGRAPALVVAGNSMAPLLRRGDRVVVEAADDLRRGDIIVRAAPDAFVTHRYWGRSARGLLTRGDRPLTPDAPWPPAELLGRVVARRRNGRRLDLDRGPGRRLNHFLTQLAAWEERRAAGRGWAAAERAGTRPLSLRAQRRALYTLAAVACAVASRHGRRDTDETAVH